MEIHEEVDIEADLVYDKEENGDVYDGTKIYADTHLSKNVHISFDVKIIGKGEVKIGAGTAIAPNTVIYTSRPCMVGGKNRYCEDHDPVTGNVTIGDNVFIGANTVIGHDVNIASGVVIGANSYVNEDITDPRTFWGGNPAKKRGKVDDNE